MSTHETITWTNPFRNLKHIEFTQCQNCRNVTLCAVYGTVFIGDRVRPAGNSLKTLCLNCIASRNLGPEWDFSGIPEVLQLLTANFLELKAALNARNAQSTTKRAFPGFSEDETEIITEMIIEYEHGWTAQCAKCKHAFRKDDANRTTCPKCLFLMLERHLAVAPEA